MLGRFLVRKAEENTEDDPPFLCYTREHSEDDVDIHTPILKRGDSEAYRNLTIARLRAKTGEDLEFISSLIA